MAAETGIVPMSCADNEKNGMYRFYKILHYGLEGTRYVWLSERMTLDEVEKELKIEPLLATEFIMYDAS